MANFVELTPSELMQVHGGMGLFSCISKIFGREGKPFIGKDFSKGVATVAQVGMIVCPVAIPVLEPVRDVAGAVAVAQK